MSELENKELDQNKSLEDIVAESTETARKANSVEKVSQPKINVEGKSDVSNLVQDDEFGYVIPRESWKVHHKKSKKIHKKKMKSRIRSKEADRLSPDEKDAMSEGYIFYEHAKKSRHKKRRRKHMAKGKKIAIIIVSIILGLAIIAASSFLILKEVGASQMHTLDTDDLDLSIPTKVAEEEVDVSDNGETIKYNGHTYKINKKISTVCLMGIDQKTTEASDENADFVNLCAIDETNKKISIIPISRETMCEINIYTDDGMYIGQDVKQLCLAFGYGNDPKQRAENVTTAVSRLCYNIPIASYFTIDLVAIPILNDDVGGVSVTPNFSFVSPEDGRQINEGESVILHGMEADTYVRHRDTSVLDSNVDRMARQQEYIKSFLSTLVPAAKSDLSVVTDLYSTVTEHSVSNLTLPKILYLASSSLDLITSSNDIEFKSISGETVKGPINAEFHPDEKDLLETILSVFYSQVD